MENDLIQLANEAMRLEYNVSKLYMIFRDAYPEDAEFWWKLVKLIRHPMYASVLLVALMLVINHLTLWRIGLWLILFIDLYFKLSYEEKLLLTKYPEYLKYKSNTKRLVPFIY